MIINCLIIDDEPSSRNVLKKYINNIENLNLIEECKNALEANLILKNQNIDLLFLDINMPKINGLDFFKTLTNPPMVIFTTAYFEYALDGFELNAVDYLLKPFSFDRFLRAINKVFDKSKIKNKNEEEVIYLKSEKKLYPIKVSDIDLIEALGDYVKLFYNSKNLIIHSTLQNILNQINYSKLCRVHKSFVIAIDKIEHIEGNQIKIINRYIPIGKSYKQDFLSRIRI